jgi:tetratricopeptide (TPR) repeat protein
MSRGWCACAALLAVGALACASEPALKLAAPSQPIDLQLPAEAPDANTMGRLPAFWAQEPQRSAYRIEAGPLSGPGNFDELDGPFSSRYARNPYLVAEGSDDERKLLTRLPAAAARPAMEQANKAFAAGALDDALSGYRQVIDRDPAFAKPYFYVAEIQSQRHDMEAATTWNDRGLRLSPRDSYGHVLRAEILASMGNDELARAALAYALALDPLSPRAIKLLRRFGGVRTPGMTPPIFVQRRAALDGAAGEPTVGATGGAAAAVLVARGGGHPAWQPYAICRALLAYDARIRSEFVQSPVQEKSPGTRSLEEETTCAYLATAAYRLSKSASAAATDADLERWSRAYDANLLREAVIYETIGCRRSEVLPLLSDEAFGRMVEYVRLFVLPATGGPGR